MSVFSTGELLLPAIWGFIWDITYRPGRGTPALPWGDASCCLVAATQRFGQGRRLSRSVNELELQNFLTMWIKELERQELW
jgi:hypothetical protein